MLVAQVAIDRIVTGQSTATRIRAGDSTRLIVLIFVCVGQIEMRIAVCHACGVIAYHLFSPVGFR
jgi:multisubunit Na+/H+ antiporter MnhF subunit